MKSKRSIVIGSLILLFWIGVIFYFSSQSSFESNQQSEDAVSVYERLNEIFDFSDNKLFNRIESFVFEDLLNNRYKGTNDKIRKSAHIGIYFILGILASFFGWIFTKKRSIASLSGVFLPLMVAVLDEFIQGLINRTARLSDVILDTVSATIGMGLFMLVLALYKAISNSKKPSHKG